MLSPLGDKKLSLLAMTTGFRLVGNRFLCIRT